MTKDRLYLYLVYSNINKEKVYSLDFVTIYFSMKVLSIILISLFLLLFLAVIATKVGELINDYFNNKFPHIEE